MPRGVGLLGKSATRKKPRVSNTDRAVGPANFHNIYFEHRQRAPAPRSHLAQAAISSSGSQPAVSHVSGYTCVWDPRGPGKPLPLQASIIPTMRTTSNIIDLTGESDSARSRSPPINRTNGGSPVALIGTGTRGQAGYERTSSMPSPSTEPVPVFERCYKKCKVCHKTWSERPMASPQNLHRRHRPVICIACKTEVFQEVLMDGIASLQGDDGERLTNDNMPDSEPLDWYWPERLDYKGYVPLSSMSPSRV